jgi:hypothetical protein
MGKKTAIDRTGQMFGLWLVIERGEKPEGLKNQNPYWLCECQCEKKTRRVVSGLSLRNGDSTSCGCKVSTRMQQLGLSNFKDISNTKFGRLLTIDVAGKTDDGHYLWNCICECGNNFVGNSKTLLSGLTKSCGCLSSEITTQRNKENALPYTQASFNEIYSKYKSKSKKRGISFDISKEDFKLLVSSNCYYSDLPPNQKFTNKNKASGEYLYNGLDRIDSNLGYTIDNVVPCVGWLNSMFKDRNVLERINQVKNILDHSDSPGIFGKVLLRLQELADKGFE